MQPAGLEPASFDRKSKILALGRRLLRRLVGRDGGVHAFVPTFRFATHGSRDGLRFTQHKKLGRGTRPLTLYNIGRTIDVKNIFPGPSPSAFLVHRSIVVDAARPNRTRHPRPARPTGLIPSIRPALRVGRIA